MRADRAVWVIDYGIAAVEIHIVDSGEAPGRAEEPSVPPVAPVLCTATFAPTGSAIRGSAPRTSSGLSSARRPRRTGYGFFGAGAEAGVATGPAARLVAPATSPSGRDEAW